MTAHANREQMFAAFEKMFKGCDTVIMTLPSLRVVNNEAMQGFTFYTGTVGQSDFRIFNVNLVGAGDIESGFSDADSLMREWLVGRRMVAHVGVDEPTAVAMVQAIWPGENADKLAMLASSDLAKKLH